MTTCTTDRAAELRQQLEAAGDPGNLFRRDKFQTDYVEEFNLIAEDIPALCDIARLWLERENWPDDDTIYCSIHAWRALGQLGAAEAAPVLLDMMEGLDGRDDDWYFEEFPHVLALMGVAAMDAAESYLADRRRREWTRVTAAHAIQEIAAQCPEARDRAVSILMRVLEDYTINATEFNAFMISYLADLCAREAARLIEKAYAAFAVDAGICGEWSEIAGQLGVEGLGLAPEVSPINSVMELRRRLLESYADRKRNAKESGLRGETSASGANSAERKRKLQQRKKQRQARKRGRR